jgi:pullulanase-type alpha-1,6-glucosidase
MAGTGIGTFNDRIRDAVRGGNPFGDRREQGVVTGLFVEPSSYGRRVEGGSDPDRILYEMDRIRVGLAGNLRDFRFVGRSGLPTRGGEHDNGGYAAGPGETINYVSAHDNETLFDKIQFAAPDDATLPERVRMQQLALSLVALGQGIPFFHAGSEMLRSKSLDRDSYDSGDWFNRLDFTYRENNFGVGLPMADKNRERWNLMKPLLANASLRPGREEIVRTVRHFEELLRIRKGSPLFRLRDAKDIQARLHFHNTGPDQVPGLIIMSVMDRLPDWPDLDPDLDRVVVLFNATPSTQEFASDAWKEKPFALHPVQAGGGDAVVKFARFESTDGRFTVPPRSTAVFVERHEGKE